MNRSNGRKTLQLVPTFTRAFIKEIHILESKAPSKRCFSSSSSSSSRRESHPIPREIYSGSGDCTAVPGLMEPAKIDWKRIESKFVHDELYERINAPKWADLSTPNQPVVDDETWFCRPDCRHPKTAEDFRRMPPSPKVSPFLTSRFNLGLFSSV